MLHGNEVLTKIQMELIRQYLPKHRRLDNVTDDEISFIMHRLNHRPRKRLDYRTPHEVFFEHQSVALET